MNKKNKEDRNTNPNQGEKPKTSPGRKKNKKNKRAISKEDPRDKEKPETQGNRKQAAQPTGTTSSNEKHVSEIPENKANKETPTKRKPGNGKKKSIQFDETTPNLPQKDDVNHHSEKN